MGGICIDEVVESMASLSNYETDDESSQRQLQSTRTHQNTTHTSGINGFSVPKNPIREASADLLFPQTSGGDLRRSGVVSGQVPAESVEVMGYNRELAYPPPAFTIRNLRRTGTKIIDDIKSIGGGTGQIRRFGYCRNDPGICGTNEGKTSHGTLL
jgi:hypothetical protein